MSDNYSFLKTSSGSELEEGLGINLAWLTDIEAENAFDSPYTPKEWKKYILKENYKPLFSRVEKTVRTKEEQLPNTIEKMALLKRVHDYFIEEDNGYGFERFATDFTCYMDSSVADDIVVTRPYKDGGVDAEGKYKIFSNAENSIYVDFYLQAKCYDVSNAVGVKDASRLISRTKKRQFGIMFTTSYVYKQAYEELLNAGHPVVLITGKNIADYIFDELEIRTVDRLSAWLESNYSR